MKLLFDPPLVEIVSEYVAERAPFYLRLLAATPKDNFTYGDERSVLEKLESLGVTISNVSYLLLFKNVRVLVPFALHDPPGSPFRRSHEKVLRNNRDLPMWVLDIQAVSVESMIAFKNQVALFNSTRMSRWFHNLYDHYNAQLQHVSE